MLKALTLGFLLSLLAPGLSVRAIEKPKYNSNIDNQIHFNPPTGGDPPDTSGAGSRDPDQLRCSPTEEMIKSLMPKTNYGLSLQKHPSIYIYLPQTSAKKVVLAFQDETEQYHETVSLPIVTTDNYRFVSFQLPADRPPLTPGKYYKWKLTVVCKEIPDVEDPTLEGWVKHVELSSVNNQLGKDVVAQAQWYAQNGYWYDLLAVLDQAVRTNPENTRLASLWHNLLKNNVDLKESNRGRVDQNEGR
ncbi:hypothetical protein RIVM261_039410 [Rivularia sp. IAM M-261]|nr:hypothetical protein RIVM261_039410 [Rivularia sp. IAM M-261]